MYPTLCFKGTNKRRADTLCGTYNEKKAKVTIYIMNCVKQAYDMDFVETEETLIDVIAHVLSHEHIHHVLSRDFGYETSRKFDKITRTCGFFWLGSGV